MEITVLTPVYNDWDSLAHLLTDLSNLSIDGTLRVLIVDDGSTRSPDLSVLQKCPLSTTVIHLNTNLGHQRAIATGLAYIHKEETLPDATIVMDCDGEDQVSDLPALLEKFQEDQQSKVIFAQRVKRSESLQFKTGYHFYKFLFRLLTGKKISFGNFSCLGPDHILKIVHNPDAWNHYSGSILKLGIPFTLVPTSRGTRYSGTSTMNTQGLFLHGLSSIALYMEQVSIQLMGLSLLGILIGAIALFVVVFIRLFTTFAIPGWATYVCLMLFNLISLMFVVSLLGLMLRLNGRTHVQLPPARLIENFILKTETY